MNFCNLSQSSKKLKLSLLKAIVKIHFYLVSFISRHWNCKTLSSVKVRNHSFYPQKQKNQCVFALGLLFWTLIAKQRLRLAAENPSFFDPAGRPATYLLRPCGKLGRRLETEVGCTPIMPRDRMRIPIQPLPIEWKKDANWLPLRTFLSRPIALSMPFIRPNSSASLPHLSTVSDTLTDCYSSSSY